jgi:drug/metabolite transporter (DMT)-like permease
LLQVAGVAAVLIGSIIVGRFASQDDDENNIEQGRFGLVIVLCILSSVCFAAPLVMAQKSSSVFGEFNTAGLMHLPATLVLVPMAWAEKTERLKLRRGVVLALLAIGILDVVALSGINFMNGLPNKELGPMGISAYGGIAVLLAMTFLKEKVQPAQWLGIALIVLGVAGLGVQAG